MTPRKDWELGGKSSQITLPPPFYNQNMTKNEVIPEGTVCRLCGKKKVGKKRFNRHHIDYSKDITVVLCYTCHSLVHSRLRFPSPWEAKYGKDKGFYELAKAFLDLYDLCMR